MIENKVYYLYDECDEGDKSKLICSGDDLLNSPIIDRILNDINNQYIIIGRDTTMLSGSFPRLESHGTLMQRFIYDCQKHNIYVKHIKLILITNNSSYMIADEYECFSMVLNVFNAMPGVAMIISPDFISGSDKYIYEKSIICDITFNRDINNVIFASIKDGEFITSSQASDSIKWDPIINNNVKYYVLFLKDPVISNLMPHVYSFICQKKAFKNISMENMPGRLELFYNLLFLPDKMKNIEKTVISSIKSRGTNIYLTLLKNMVINHKKQLTNTSIDEIHGFIGSDPSSLLNDLEVSFIDFADSIFNDSKIIYSLFFSETLIDEVYEDSGNKLIIFHKPDIYEDKYIPYKLPDSSKTVTSACFYIYNDSDNFVNYFIGFTYNGVQLIYDQHYNLLFPCEWIQYPEFIERRYNGFKYDIEFIVYS